MEKSWQEDKADTPDIVESNKWEWTNKFALAVFGKS